MTAPDASRARSPSSAFRRGESFSSSASYRTRVLGCTIAALLVPIAAVNLPFFRGLDAIGWHVSALGDRVTVDMISAVQESKEDIGTLITRFESKLEEPEILDEGEEMHVDSSFTAVDDVTDRDQALDRLTGRKVFDFAQQMPEIVGGLGAYYIHIEYPEEALKQGIEGRLLLSFIVEMDGTTSDVAVISSLHPACDSAAVQALRATHFVPGRQNGRRVPVRMRLPVRFKLVEPGQPRAVPPISQRSSGA